MLFRSVNRGVASGPFCFVYGTAAVLMAVGFADLRSTPVALFLGCAANSTVVEWVTAKLLERMHRRRWWDYSDKKFNLDGYVCLQYSVLWGLLGMASVLWGNVLLLRLCAILPGWLLHIGVWAAMTLAVLDQLGAALAASLSCYKRERWLVMCHRIIEEIPFALSHDKTKGMVKIYCIN